MKKRRNQHPLVEIPFEYILQVITCFEILASYRVILDKRVVRKQTYQANGLRRISYCQPSNAIDLQDTANLQVHKATPYQMNHQRLVLEPSGFP